MSGRLTDEQVRRLWALLREEPPPYTWRDHVRYWLSWRPRWAVQLWRHRRW